MPAPGCSAKGRQAEARVPQQGTEALRPPELVAELQVANEPRLAPLVTDPPPEPLAVWTWSETALPKVPAVAALPAVPHHVPIEPTVPTEPTQLKAAPCVVAAVACVA